MLELDTATELLDLALLLVTAVLELEVLGAELELTATELLDLMLELEELLGVELATEELDELGAKLLDLLLELELTGAELELTAAELLDLTLELEELLGVELATDEELDELGAKLLDLLLELELAGAELELTATELLDLLLELAGAELELATLELLVALPFEDETKDELEFVVPPFVLDELLDSIAGALELEVAATLLETDDEDTVPVTELEMLDCEVAATELLDAAVLTVEDAAVEDGVGELPLPPPPPPPHAVSVKLETSTPQ